ncbi:hypothetical protein B0J14DRAFT_662137 [Halenospora varia]|nr:hypothetical protein B0J14DRAFT_662137 [Halenospora varia]
MAPNTPVKSVTIDCIKNDNNGALEDICNIDCYAILYLERPTRLHYVADSKIQGQNRVNSGQGIQPFKTDKLTQFGTTRLDADHVSPEEFPFASTNQGGSGYLDTQKGDAVDPKHQSIIAGVQINGQYSQGGALKAGYAAALLKGKVSKLEPGEWYDLTILSNAPYCKLLYPAGKLNNYSSVDRNKYCKKDKKDPKDAVNRAYVKITGKSEPKAQFQRAIRGEGIFKYLI